MGERPGLIMPKNDGKKVKFKSFQLGDGFVNALDEEGQLWYGEAEFNDEGEYLHVVWKKVNMPSGDEG